MGFAMPPYFGSVIKLAREVHVINEKRKQDPFARATRSKGEKKRNRSKRGYV